MIVADTNLVVYLFVSSEFTERARQVYAVDPDWYFPPITLSEAANVLATLTRESWITSKAAAEALESIEKRIMAGLREVSMRESMELAIERRISAYDAQFIVLARSLGVSLVSADGRLRKAFPEIALSMEEFMVRGKGWVVREERANYGSGRRKGK